MTITIALTDTEQAYLQGQLQPAAISSEEFLAMTEQRVE
jgi:hypothetical protein